MPHIILGAVGYGGYISVTKLVVFLVLFFPWLLVVKWVNNDAEAVGTDRVFWTGAVAGAGALGVLLFLLVPWFPAAVLLYLVAAGVSSISYVMHRNSRVMDYDRVLTAEHLKGLLLSDKQKTDNLKGLTFFTANNNEVPTPEARTPDFFGYKAAYDLFTDAIRRRAETVAFTPTQQGYSTTYLVDGVGLKQPAISREQMDFLSRFLKLLANLDVNEKRKPQKGKFRIRQDQKDYEWEVVTAGSTAGEQIQLMLKTHEQLAKVSELGLTSSQVEQLSSIRQAKQGLFLITGPPKSGVSTTFYALIRSHDPFIFNVNTLERQPSAEIMNVTQHVFQLSDTGTTTFAKKLQSIVRMGVDVVGVADCTDAETARVACETALNGKIVYVTLQADNVVQTIAKWMKLVGDRNLAVDPLLGISNQRILRKLCPECKQAYEPNKEILRKFNIPAEKVKVFYRAGKVVYDRHGKPSTCEYCQGTGFYGRMCVFEMIMMNSGLKKAIKQAQSLSEIGTHFRRAKMLYLQEEALKRVIEGTTSINEMVRVLSGSKKEKARKSG